MLLEPKTKWVADLRYGEVTPDRMGRGQRNLAWDRGRIFAVDNFLRIVSGSGYIRI